MAKTTITINGRLYDAITGMPVAMQPHQPVKKAATAPSAKQTQPQPTQRAVNDIGRPAPQTHTAKAGRAANQPAAHAVHQRTQKSQTLYRKALKKPSPQAAPTAAHIAHKEPPATHRSPLIKKFADQASTSTQQTQQMPQAQQPQSTSTVAPPVHPTVAKIVRAQHEQHVAATKPQPSGKELKEMLIKERLDEVGAPKKEQKRHGWLARQSRLATVLTATLALLILGGYLTYMTLPSISMRVAASRAGVSATMPNYKPDGYSLNGPITYSPGEVVIHYKSNTNQNGYTLTQKASNWDSQAVLDNYVTKHTDNYLTFQERGLTIYTFDNKAAWVNGGLLYTLDGDVGLSSEQILRVATSM